ncbi:MAG: transporter substrate-binding domain-containing protein [Leptospiraceae bacterium]|nr:transporter substrate-binding domain-containing protein [Leptospiraceae bacterium]
MARTGFIVCIATILLASSLSARELRVGYGGSRPFINTEGQATTGIAVDIWQQVNRYTGFRYRPVARGTVAEMLTLLQQKKIDVIVGPVSITEDRHEQFGFSHPFYLTSPAILTSRSDTSFWKMIQPFLSGPFLIGVLTLLGVLFMVGSLIWIVEHKDNDSFSTDPVAGIGQGIWFAIVTFTTVGYGDLVPIGKKGRMLAGVWMITAMITASSLTAGIASAFTLFQLQHAAIQNPSDLAGRAVAVILGSSGEDFAKRFSSRLVEASSLDEAISLIRKKKADALVYDYPVLRFLVNDDSDLRLVRTHELSEHYCFVFRKDDPAIDGVDTAILKLKEGGLLRKTLNRWGLDREGEE